MPAFVASIEVYFSAPTITDAAMFADALGDAAQDTEQPTVLVSAVTSGVAPASDAPTPTGARPFVGNGHAVEW